MEPRFDVWWAPKAEEMRNDPLLRYLYLLRSKILKEGVDQITAESRIDGFDFSSLGPGPSGATGSMIGGVGASVTYFVPRADGIDAHVHVPLPPEVVVGVRFEKLPAKHQDKPLADDSVEYICSLYYVYLRDLVVQAEKEFLSPGEIPSWM
jgi:hypothetical protein